MSDLSCNPHLTSPWEGEELHRGCVAMLPRTQRLTSPSQGEVRWEAHQP